MKKDKQKILPAIRYAVTFIITLVIVIIIPKHIQAATPQSVSIEKPAVPQSVRIDAAAIPQSAGTVQSPAAAVITEQNITVTPQPDANQPQNNNIKASLSISEQNDIILDSKTSGQTSLADNPPSTEEVIDMLQLKKRPAKIDSFIEAAQEQLGKPYVFGNVGPDSFDCSGLVYYCLEQAGLSLDRHTASTYSKTDEWEKITSMEDLEKGDILFFSTDGKRVGHTGIYIGNGEMIDASSSKRKIVRRSCMTSFWTDNFVVARRPL